MLKPPSKCRRIELHFVTLQDKINLIKESESFPKPSRSCLLFFFLVWCHLVFSRIFTPVVSGIISVNNVISWILYCISLLEQRALWFLYSMKNILQQATNPIQGQWPENLVVDCTLNTFVKQVTTIFIII